MSFTGSYSGTLGTFNAQVTEDNLVLVEGSAGQFTSHGGFASFRNQIQTPTFNQLPGAIVTPLGPQYTLPSVTYPALKSINRGGGLVGQKLYEFMFVIKNVDPFNPMLNVIGGAGWNVTPFDIPLNQSAFVLVQQNQQQCTAYTYMSGSTGFLVPGVSGVDTGASGLTLPGGFTIALANSGVAAGTYGDAANMPVLTIDARGRITTATTVAVSTVDQLLSVATRNWGAGTGRNVGVSDNVAIGDGVQTIQNQGVAIGSQASAAQKSTAVGYNAKATVGSSTAYGFNSRAINGNTIIGSYTTQPNASGLNTTYVGQDSGPLATTGDGNTGLGSSAAWLTTTGIRNTSLGAFATPRAGATFYALPVGYAAYAGDQGVSVGALSGSPSSGSNNTNVGFQAGGQTTGNDNTCVGANSKISAGVNQSCAFGDLAETRQNNSNTIGYQVINDEVNTTRIGSNGSASHTVRSEGFFKSGAAVSTAAGINPGTDAAQAIAAFPTTLDLKSTRFEIFQSASNVDLAADLINLGSHPYDLSSTFMVSASILGTASAASYNFLLELMWVAPGVVAAPGVAISREQLSGSDTNVAATLSTLVNVPAISTGRNYVYCRLSRTSGVQTITITDYRLSVGRLA